MSYPKLWLTWNVRQTPFFPSDASEALLICTYILFSLFLDGTHFCFLHVPNYIFGLFRFEALLYGGKTLLTICKICLSYFDSLTSNRCIPVTNLNVILSPPPPSPTAWWSNILSARLGAYDWCPRTCVQCVELLLKNYKLLYGHTIW